MSMKSFVVACALLPVLLTAETNELSFARQALRDGLWSVARNHAARVEGDSAKLLTLETYVREGKWESLLKTLAQWGNPDSEGFRYYRAVGLFKTGSAELALRTVETKPFTNEQYRASSVRLRALVAQSMGKNGRALDILRSEGDDDPETLMMVAELLERTGGTAAAESVWRSVVSKTNLTEGMLATAAAHLGDIPLLRKAYSNATSVVVRRFAGLRLGLGLIRDDATFAEGAKLVRSFVSAAPDAPGAREAFAEFANRLLERGELEDAVHAYGELIESWPEAAKDAAVLEGRGWAYLRLGRLKEAQSSFQRASEVADDDETRAEVLVKMGDVLSALGDESAAMETYRGVMAKYPKTKAGGLVANIVRIRELESLGRKQYAEFHFAEAQKTFEEVAKKDSVRKPYMDYFAVLCLYGQGRDDEAERKARALMVMSENPSVRAASTLWLAKLQYNREQWKSSQALFAAYVEQQTDSPKAGEALVWSARAAFAENDYALSVATVAQLLSKYPESPMRAAGLLVQGEALIELARFDEAVLVLDRVSSIPGVSAGERLRSQTLRADALFAMGADNPKRYQEALDVYRTVLMGEDLSPSMRLSIAFKVGRTLEKLRRQDEATDQYYTQVVLAYREGRARGVHYDDEARAAFSRAVFRLADEMESRGESYQAVRVLELLVASDVPAASEAARRIERMKKKGNYL